VPSARGSFVLSDAGSCTFCGKDRAEVSALVGIDGRPERICNECIGLCWDILAEEVDISVDDETFEAHMAEVLRRLADARVLRRDAELRDESGFYDPLRRAQLLRFRCSFCDAHRMAVLKLISGPRVFICDRCVGDATAVVKEALRTT
jgi:ATP-dependent protease Clp ATPase subunit